MPTGHPNSPCLPKGVPYCVDPWWTFSPPPGDLPPPGSRGLGWRRELESPALLYSPVYPSSGLEVPFPLCLYQQPPKAVSAPLAQRYALHRLMPQKNQPERGSGLKQLLFLFSWLQTSPEAGKYRNPMKGFLGRKHDKDAWMRAAQKNIIQATCLWFECFSKKQLKEWLFCFLPKLMVS